MRTRGVLILALLSGLGACMTAELSPEGAKVAPTRDSLPEDCKDVGTVVGEGTGTYATEHAMNDLRNRAADLGATHVRHDAPTLTQNAMSANVTGTAYECL